MTDKVFMDTNLWIYLYSDDDKSAIVAELVNQNVDDIILSAQVLGELFSVITRKKLKTLPAATQIVGDIASLYEVAGLDRFSVAKAIQIHTKYQYSYYDSLIIASALENDCTILYTEDMQAGQVIEGALTIVNPFLTNTTN
jgi:predicted nucleic acid-binding protein